MGRDEQLDEFKKYMNEYTESKRKTEEIIREETLVQNICHSKMLQLYKSKNRRDKIIKKAEELNYNPDSVNKLKTISAINPFDIKNVSITDLKEFYTAQLFTQRMKQDEKNIIFEIADEATRIILFNEDNTGGDSS